MHGGAKGSGGPQGDRNGKFKHGVWTRESVDLHGAIRAKVREIRGPGTDRSKQERQAARMAPRKYGNRR
jgi:hypothetical protein